MNSSSIRLLATEIIVVWHHGLQQHLH